MLQHWTSPGIGQVLGMRRVTGRLVSLEESREGEAATFTPRPPSRLPWLDEDPKEY